VLTLKFLLLAPLAILAGSSFVVQQVVNAQLRTELASVWWAGFVSYLGGTLAMLAMIVVLREPMLSLGMIGRTNLSAWTGGVFGALYIAISILLVPRLGAATVVALIVVGQMLTALAFDHYAMLGAPHYPLTPARLLGAALLIAGAILMRL